MGYYCRGFLLIKASPDILSQQVWLGKCKLNICDGFEGFTTQDTILIDRPGVAGAVLQTAS